MGDLWGSDSSFFNWILLPFLIFVARILDVSMETLRVICIARGFKKLAPIVGFFEILIWIIAISQIMKNLSNAVCYIAYAGGFAMGSYVGMCLAEKLALGMVMLRVITSKNAQKIADSIIESNYGLTCMDATGVQGQEKVILTVVPRSNIKKIVELVKEHSPEAFYSIQEVDFAHGVKLPFKEGWAEPGVNSLFRLLRRGK